MSQEESDRTPEAETETEQVPAPEGEAAAEPESQGASDTSAEATAPAQEPDEATAPAQEPDEASPDATPVPAPAAALGPKERRRQARSAHGAPRPPRTPEQRQAEREEARRARSVSRRAARARAGARRTERPGVAEPVEPLHASRPAATPKVRQGVVVSDKADKTITVRIDASRRHRRYQKIMRSSATLHAHDEGNEAREGDRVSVMESRPLSRTKRWRLVRVLERAR